MKEKPSQAAPHSALLDRCQHGDQISGPVLRKRPQVSGDARRRFHRVYDNRVVTSEGFGSLPLFVLCQTPQRGVMMVGRPFKAGKASTASHPVAYATG